MRITLLVYFCVALSLFTYGQTCLSGGITFNSQQQINDFASDHPGCTTIEGNVFINDAVPNVITNLNGLNQLTNIEGDLFISSNPSLNNLNGLENLTSIDGLFIVQNNAILSDLFPSANLTQVGPLDIRNNASLTDLGGLENVQSIGGYLRLWNNSILTDIDELSSVNSLSFYLEIKANNLLTNITGLQNLTLINGWINVTDNPLLNSLAGLESINPFTVNNPFSSLPDIEITNNASLSICDVLSICDALLLPGTITDIQNNAPGCNSEAEVQTACNALPVTWLTPLTATLQEGKVLLYWSVTEQENNETFIVEWSTDGRGFNELSSIPGQRNYYSQVDHSYLHDNPANGENYYRIKQVDLNGSFSFGNTAQVKLDSRTFEFSPNPIHSELTITTSKSDKGAIVNVQGQVLKQLVIHRGVTLIDVAGLTPGIYFLKTDSGIIKKLIKH